MARRITIKKAWEGKANCVSCSMRDSALFSGLADQDFQVVHQQVEQVTLSPGDLLYGMGEEGRHLFTVREGLIKLVHYQSNGAQRIVRLAKGADVLGLEMMLDQNYQHEAIVLRTTKLCRYPKDAIIGLSQKSPVLHKNLMVRWQKALTEADIWLTRLSTGSAKKRMANMLLYLIDGEDSAECYIFSREDMGSILSITVETASRTLSEFKRSGLITDIHHNHFHLDVAGLEAIVAD